MVPIDECEKKGLQLRYNFTWCNKMDKGITGRAKQTFIRVKGWAKDMGLIDLDPMECQWKQVTVMVNTCKDDTLAQIQYEGQLDGV